MTLAIHPKEKLIATAARLVHQQGWTATGINQILTEADIPKGSFYYYFKSKEALGISVFQYYHVKVQEILQKSLLTEGTPAQQAVELYFKECEKFLIESGYRFGCPLGSFANEVSATSETLATQAKSTFYAFEKAWEDVILRGQNDGDITKEVSANELAQLIVMLLEGAFLKMKYTSNMDSLKLVQVYIQQKLFGATRLEKQSHLRAVDGIDIGPDEKIVRSMAS